MTLCVLRRRGSTLSKYIWRTFSARASQKVNIVEVGPRDGLQNESRTVPTATKIEFIRRLASTGVKTIECTSFVSPKWVPQLGDAAEVVKALPKVSQAEINHPVLIPNERGLENLLKMENHDRAGVEEISIFAAATETFSQRNINCSIEDSFKRFEKVITLASQNGLRIRGYLSVCLGCPYEGKVDARQVARLAKALQDLGCYEISICDTNGVGTPTEVENVFNELDKANVPTKMLAGHFHDTYGIGVANLIHALNMGIRTFDAACAGLGGCPYSPGARGNVSTEDVVYALHGLGFETAIDLEKIAEIGDWISGQLGRPNASRTGSAICSQKLLKKQDSMEL